MGIEGRSGEILPDFTFHILHAYPSLKPGNVYFFCFVIINNCKKNMFSSWSFVLATLLWNEERTEMELCPV